MDRPQAPVIPVPVKAGSQPGQARPVVLIRYGEIALKGDNRADFEYQLQHNLQAALRPAGGVRVHRLYGRMMVEGMEPGAPQQAVAAAAGRVFGVVGAAPALEVPLDLAALQAAAVALTEEALGSFPGSGPAAPAQPLPFKVAARRSHKRFPLDSMQLNQEIGAHLLRTFGERLRVDLHSPRLVVHVEIRDREGFVYGPEVPGPGGLPIGVSGRSLALLSGGIDSPVAAWMAMKRGLVVDGIHFHAIPFTSHQARWKVVQLAQVLSRWSAGRPVRLFAVPFGEIQKAIYHAAPAELGILLMRRFMLRIAEQVADRYGHQAFITGENLGQVASQTLASLEVVGLAARRPVLRPLVAFDKQEIVERARHIGTYEISVQPFEDCCTLFVARHPETRPAAAPLEAAEAALPVDALVAEAGAGVEEVVLEDGQIVADRSPEWARNDPTG